VTLDGQSLLAIIDTGATYTTITSKLAQESFGLTPSSPGMEPAGNVNGDPKLFSYSHTFSSLALDGITIKNLRIIVMPDRVTDEKSPRYRYYLSGGKLYSQKRLELPELILGMDVLKHLRLYFAFDEHNLYATPADLPPVTVSDTAAKTPKLSPEVTAALREAQAAFRKKDYPAAQAAVSKARAVTELQPFDVYTIHRFALSIDVALKDLAAADVEAEAAADSDSSLIAARDRAMVFKAALQLALNSRHYDKAVGYAKLYQATNPPASDQALISAALSHAGNSDGAGSSAAPEK
jgi:hypothetical protein